MTLERRNGNVYYYRKTRDGNRALLKQTTKFSAYLRACKSLAKVRKLLAEAELREQQARNKRSQSTLIAQKVLENAIK